MPFSKGDNSYQKYLLGKIVLGGKGGQFYRLAYIQREEGFIKLGGIIVHDKQSTRELIYFYPST